MSNNIIFDIHKFGLLSAADIWTSSSIYCMLVDSSSTYVPNPASTSLAGLTSGGLVELSAAGYTAGGQVLTGKSVTPGTPDAAYCMAANLSWPNIGTSSPIKNIKAILLYIHTGTPSTSIVIAYIDSIGPIPVNGGNLVLAWPNGGQVISVA